MIDPRRERAPLPRRGRRRAAGPGGVAILLLFFFVLLFSLPARAQVEVVRNGQVVQTRTTLQEAVDSDASPGDTLRLKSGSYFECVNIKKSGQAGQPITIEAEPGGKVVIDGAYQPWTKPQNGLFNPDAGEFYSAAAPGFSISYNVNQPSAALVGGQRLWTYQNDSAALSFKVGSGVYYSTAEKKMYVRFEGGEDPGDKALSISRCTGALSFSGAQHWVVRDLTVQNGAYASIMIGGFLGVTASNIKLSNLTVRNGMNGVVIMNAGSSNNVVEGCKIGTDYPSDWYWSDFKDSRTDMEGTGIYVIEAGSDNDIHGNTITGFFNGIGTWSEQASASMIVNTRIYRNIINHVWDDALELESGDTNTRVYENMIHDAFVALSLSPVMLGPVYIYRNVVIADRTINFTRSSSKQGPPCVIKTGASGRKTKNVKLYHNTFYGTNHVMDGSWGGSNPPEAFEWLNNIFYSTSSLLVVSTGSVSTGNKLDGNLYHRVTPGDIIKNWNCSSWCPTFTTLAAALASGGGKAAGWEAHGLQSDPRFTSTAPGALDLHLQKDSPARDKAVALPAGWPETVTAAAGAGKDIGAYEENGATGSDWSIPPPPPSDGRPSGDGQPPADGGPGGPDGWDPGEPGCDCRAIRGSTCGGAGLLLLAAALLGLRARRAAHQRSRSRTSSSSRSS